MKLQTALPDARGGVWKHLVPLIGSDCPLDVLQQPAQLRSAAPARKRARDSRKDARGVLGAEGVQCAEAQVKAPRQQLQSDCQPACAHNTVCHAWALLAMVDIWFWVLT